MSAAVVESGTGLGKEPRKDLQTQMLRSRLVNLTLGWEVTALSLDAERYRTSGIGERESLRESAGAYRKCIAELTEVLAGNSIL